MYDNTRNKAPYSFGTWHALTCNCLSPTHPPTVSGNTRLRRCGCWERACHKGQLTNTGSTCTAHVRGFGSLEFRLKTTLAQSAAVRFHRQERVAFISSTLSFSHSLFAVSRGKPYDSTPPPNTQSTRARASGSRIVQIADGLHVHV